MVPDPVFWDYLKEYFTYSYYRGMAFCLAEVYGEAASAQQRVIFCYGKGTLPKSMPSQPSLASSFPTSAPSFDIME